MPTTVQTSDLTAHDIASVHALIAPWCQACIQRDWDALLAMCTADVVFLPPGGPLVTGDGVIPWLDAFPQVTAMWWDIKHMEGKSDLAVLRGGVTMNMLIDGQSVVFDGKYSDVIRKEGDGKWRVASVCWNPNA